MILVRSDHPLEIVYQGRCKVAVHWLSASATTTQGRYQRSTLASRVSGAIFNAFAILMNSGTSMRRSPDSIFAIRVRCHPSRSARSSWVILASRREAARTVTTARCHLLRSDFGDVEFTDCARFRAL